MVHVGAHVWRDNAAAKPSGWRMCALGVAMHLSGQCWLAQ